MKKKIVFYLVFNIRVNFVANNQSNERNVKEIKLTERNQIKNFFSAWNSRDFWVTLPIHFYNRVWLQITLLVHFKLSYFWMRPQQIAALLSMSRSWKIWLCQTRKYCINIEYKFNFFAKARYGPNKLPINLWQKNTLQQTFSSIFSHKTFKKLSKLTAR